MIEAALLAEVNPSLSKKKFGLDWSADKAKEIGGLYSLIGILPSAVNSLLKIELDTEKVIVFDDLERCNLDMTALLGIINWFVEHHNSKVVVMNLDASRVMSTELVCWQLNEIGPLNCERLWKLMPQL